MFLLVVISPDLCFYLALNNLRQSYFLSSLWFFATRLLVWQIYYFFVALGLPPRASILAILGKIGPHGGGILLLFLIICPYGGHIMLFIFLLMLDS